jgi:hypothetical protein
MEMCQGSGNVQAEDCQVTSRLIIIRPTVTSRLIIIIRPTVLDLNPAQLIHHQLCMSVSGGQERGYIQYSHSLSHR